MPDAPRLIRDRITLTCYAMVGAYAFFLYFVGPVTPLIADELGVGLQLAGTTSLMVATGLIASGVAGPAAVRRLGRGRTALACAAVLAIGALALAAAPAFWAVLVTVACATLAGAVLMNVSTATLNDRHGDAAPAAITEGQAIAAWLGLVAPLLIGAMVAIGLGWRAGAVGVAAVAVALVVVLLSMRAPLADGADPGSPDRPGVAGPAPRFGSLFVWSLAGIVAAAGAEFSLNFWGGVLIAGNTGADLATTTACLSALVGGIAIGRTAGSALTRRFEARPLVLSSLGLATGGFLVVWLSPWLWLAVAGLLVTGLGLALLFPLMVSLAMFHGRARSDRAAAVISIVVGTSIGTAPFVLAALAGWLGVGRAFFIVPLLLAGGVLAVRRAAPAGTATPAEGAVAAGEP